MVTVQAVNAFAMLFCVPRSLFTDKWMNIAIESWNNSRRRVFYNRSVD